MYQEVPVIFRKMMFSSLWIICVLLFVADPYSGIFVGPDWSQYQYVEQSFISNRQVAFSSEHPVHFTQSYFELFSLFLDAGLPI